MTRTSSKQQESGFALVAALLLTAMLTVVGVSTLMTTDLEVRSSAVDRLSTEAFYVAEAGVQRAIGKIVEDEDWARNLVDPSNAFPTDNAIGGGKYRVEIFVDDPVAEQVRIRSTGQTGGYDKARATIEVIGRRVPGFPRILDYVIFSCGDMILKEGDHYIMSADAFIGGNLDMESDGVHRILNANVSSMGSINMNLDSQIIGDVTANGRVNVNGTHNPNIDGDVVSGDQISGSGTISGSHTDNVSPLPVEDKCSGSEMSQIAFTTAHMDELRSVADQTFENLTLESETTTLSGVVHVEGNLQIIGDVFLSENVVLLVDGDAEIIGPGTLRSDPPGATATILVPDGNLEIKGTGALEVDGFIQVGTVSPDGTAFTGGNLEVNGISQLVINGSSSTVNGAASANWDAEAGSNFLLNYTIPTDENLRIDRINGEFITLSWRDVRN